MPWARSQIAEEAHTDKTGTVTSMGNRGTATPDREYGKNIPIHQSTVYNDILGRVSWEGRDLIAARCPAVSSLRAQLVRSIQHLSPPGGTTMVDF